MEEEKEMADNKNMTLDDDLLLQASGGVTRDEDSIPRFDAVGTVVRYLGNQLYQVCLSDGGEVTANFNERHIVEEGTQVGLIAKMGGWQMEEIR